MDTGAVQKPYNTVATLLSLASRQLSHLHDGRLDAEYLLAHAMNRSRTWLHTWPDKTVGPDYAATFDGLVQQRAIGMPLAYLTGEREFWSLPLRVSPDTLIPRPETERLVELALQHADDASVIIDLGTGSGAIALAVATELPDKTIIATDFSGDALQIARHNALRLKCALQFLQCNWLNAVSHDSADLIVSNPPYIENGDEHLRGDGVLFEPAAALLGGPDGLDAYRQIVPQAARCLRRPGVLLVEHGSDQAAPVRELMSEAGFVDMTTWQDFAGLDRVTAGRCR